MARETSNDEITLGVLAAIEADAKISQRTLSRELGVALGLTNAYLKRCVRKGFIKVQQIPSRRYGYYLTPQGFAEKTRLTGEYLAASLTFFRRARAQMDEIIANCAAHGHRRIVLIGACELAEIATLTAHDHDVTIVGVLDATLNRATFCGLPVARRLDELPQVDAAILTQSLDSRGVVRELTQRLGEGRVHTPRLVRPAHVRQTAISARASEPRPATGTVSSGE